VDIADLIDPQRIRCGVEGSSKKRSLEDLSRLLATVAPDLTSEEIFESLIGRERLGSTGLGHGVAIPHGRLAALREPVAAIITLDKGIDFDAADKQPVDLLFALLVPTDAAQEHLELLAQLARMFNDPGFRERLRACHDPADAARQFRLWQPRRDTA